MIRRVFSAVSGCALLVLFACGMARPAFADILNAGTTSNNGGSANWAIFFDVQSTTNLTITHLATASTAAAGAGFTVQVYSRVGTALGGPVAAGPGSSSTGWTSLGTASATQGAVANDISLPIDIPDILLPSGQLTGIAVVFTGAGPRYSNVASYTVYSDTNLSLTTGDARSVPFTATGSWFSPRALVGSLTYVTTTPVELTTFGVD